MRWRQTEGLLLGALDVLSFSFTFPAVRAAAPALGGTVVGLSRALVAAVLAGIVLLARREPLPAKRYWRGLAIVALGTVIGFPLCSSLALEHLPAAHGAVVVGLLPAATAVMAVLRAGERPSKIFWLGCIVGVITVLQRVQVAFPGGRIARLVNRYHHIQTLVTAYVVGHALEGRVVTLGSRANCPRRYNRA